MGLPYFVRAHLYVGEAHIHKRALRGRAVHRTSPLHLVVQSKGAAFETAPARRAVLRTASHNKVIIAEGR